MGLYINTNLSAGTGQNYLKNNINIGKASKYFLNKEPDSSNKGYLTLLGNQEITAPDTNCQAYNLLNVGTTIPIQGANTILNGFTSQVGDLFVTDVQAGHKHILIVQIEKGAAPDYTPIITKVLNPDSVSSGCVLKELIAGEDLGFFQAVRIGNDGKIYKFKANEPEYQEQCLGITVLPATTDDTVVIIMMGEMIIEYGDFEIGEEYFVDINGDLTNTPPTVSNTIVQSVGTALANGVFIVKVKQSFLKP